MQPERLFLYDMRRGEKERIHSLFSETMTAENNNMQQT
jgi:hypothetical protein